MAQPPLEFSVARDFRLPGAPTGYIVVQTAAYYAWWEIHQPDTVCVHRPDGEGPEWLTLRVGGSLTLADGSVRGDAGPAALANTKDLEQQSAAGREWAGWSVAAERLELLFRAGEAPEALEHRVVFHPDRIEYRLRAPLPTPAQVRTCVLGQTADGRRLAFQASEVFNAGPIAHGSYLAPLHRPQYIRPDWFTPPPYCYAFHLADDSWMSAALEAPIGGMPFQQFRTLPDAGGALAFSVEYPSTPTLREQFASPALVFRFGAADPAAALRQHAEGLVANGTLPQVERRDSPAWWRGTMVCGWHWQCHEAKRLQTNWGGACRQDLYEDMLAALAAKGIACDILTIDMFWGARHGIWRADPARWPDLRGFIDRQHAAGRHVLLWICTNVNGLPDEELYQVGEKRLLDPHNPLWLRRLAEDCRHMFGDGPDCLGADGLKFDFTEAMPPAGTPRAARELHGLDYLRALFAAVHDAAKAVRSDLLMDFQVANPAFAGLYDMTRLNDYFLPARQDLRVMRTRAEIAHAVGFGALVDVDGPASEAYFRASPAFGNPSLYLCAQHLEDPALVAAIRGAMRL